MIVEDDVTEAIHKINHVAADSLGRIFTSHDDTQLRGILQTLLAERDERIRLLEAEAARVRNWWHESRRNARTAIGKYSRYRTETENTITALRTDLANHRATIAGLVTTVAKLEQQIKRMKDLHDTDCLIMRQQQAAIKEAREKSNA